jgi:hypothetical protein
MGLADKLRKAREIEIEAGEFVFTARRPTDLEMIGIRASKSSETLLPFVIGWKKKDGTLPSEMDLGLPHGDPHPLPFDAEACAEFLSDRVDLFQVVMERLVSAYVEHANQLGEAAKN